MNRNFFNKDNTNNVNAHEVENRMSSDYVENEYGNLLFKEQVSLLALHELSDAGIDDREDGNRMSCGIRYSNPQFYPKKSRVPALDTFQMKVEKDLVALKNK